MSFTDDKWYTEVAICGYRVDATGQSYPLWKMLSASKVRPDCQQNDSTNDLEKLLYATHIN